MSMKLMEREHQAWLDTGAKFEELGHSWNDADVAAFHAAILVWGERLVALRAEQTLEQRVVALNDALDREIASRRK